MGLSEYRRKRRFGITSEPAGKVGRRRVVGTQLAFVVQKHRATALHYDFRLEWRGVMLSWAVPKGPCFDPAQKRTAIRVEDHPIAYNQFEGVIPAGQYGGGTVMIWDRGSWTPEDDDVDAALERGTLKFSLEGEKLRGAWVLVRTRARGGERRGAWLLIKRRDAWAGADDVTEREPRSVVTQRLLVEIARDEHGDMRRAADGDPPALLRKLLVTTAARAASKRRRRTAGRDAGARAQRTSAR
jgi:bifunctional non-homologous end joining protein LigD